MEIPETLPIHPFNLEPIFYAKNGFVYEDGSAMLPNDDGDYCYVDVQTMRKVVAERGLRYKF